MQSKYRHILLSNDNGQRLELQDAPVGWDATKFRLIRDLTYFGILKSISVEFEFVGDGYEFLQTQRLRYGIDADVTIRVYKRNPNEFLYEGKINNENFLEDRKFRKYKVDIIQSSFVQNFNNRDDVKLNILNTLSLDRKPITAASAKLANIRGKEILFYSEFNGSSISAEAEPFSIYHHTLPFFLIKNGNTRQVQESFYAEQTAAWDPLTVDDPLIVKENAVYVNNLPENQTPNIKGNARTTLVYKAVLNYTTLQLYNKIRFLLVNEDNTVAATLYTTDLNVYQQFQGASISYNFMWDFTPTVAPGQYVIFLAERWVHNLGDDGRLPVDTEEMEDDGLFGFMAETYYPTLYLEITDASIITETSHPVILPHELFSNLVAQINGGEFYSEFFGRTELGYEADGDGAFLGITKGELLRGIPLEEIQITTSLREAFQSYSSVFCLGALITEGRLRVEPLDLLFNANIAAELGDVNDLAISPTKEFLFNSTKCGYPDNEYEEENGRDEFNTTYQYTNSLKAVKKELDLVSKYNGDGYGIEFARRESVVTTGTKDSKYDKIIFLIDLIKVEPLVEGDPYTLKSRRLEGITYVAGIFSPETALNLRIAAGQNMLRWKKYLNIPIFKKPKVYYFQSKEKNAGLELVTPLGTTIDGQDLQVGSATYFLPEARTFKAPITIELLFAIMDNPLGMVSYKYEGEKFFDHVFEVDAETDKGMAEWRMLGTKETPVEIEEDGGVAAGNIIKYNDGLTDFLKYADGETDYILYQ